MRRYPPSTIYRYLDLSSTQRIRTHNSHRHNTTKPWYKHPTHSPPTPPPTQTQTHVQPPPVPTGLVKIKTNRLIHSHHLSLSTHLSTPPLHPPLHPPLPHLSTHLSTHLFTHLSTHAAPSTSQTYHTKPSPEM